MKPFDWNPEKNRTLIEEREISFEEVVVAVSEGHLLDVLTHPHPEKYPNQQMMIVRIYDYAYLIPFVENDEKIFLKTIIPSRKATKKYLQKGNK